MGKKRKKTPAAQQPEPTNPLAAALLGSGLKASAPSPEPAAAPAPAASLSPWQLGPKLVLRRERKGRGGKTVTLVQGVRSGREALARALRKALGTGARVEGDDIVLQGDRGDAAEDWLLAQGAREVVRGS